MKEGGKRKEEREPNSRQMYFLISASRKIFAVNCVPQTQDYKWIFCTFLYLSVKLVVWRQTDHQVGLKRGLFWRRLELTGLLRKKLAWKKSLHFIS